MKYILSLFLFFGSSLAHAQLPTHIQVIVPHKSDEVYISGNQPSLGDWNPDQIKMQKVSDFVREIHLDLAFPAEFKFSRGSWESEALIKNPLREKKIKVRKKPENTLSYVIQAWKDQDSQFQITTAFEIKSIASKVFNQNRKVFVYKPQNYSPQKKYPLIFITDADQSRNFELAMSHIKQLSRFQLIPECLLIGIVQENRRQELDPAFGPGGEKFKEFIFKELLPYIDQNYASSGFKAMIGHSDGATYNHSLMYQSNNPFSVFANLSEDLQKNLPYRNPAPYQAAISAYKNFLREYKGKGLSIFLANGDFDIWHRKASGLIIDSLHQVIPNDKITFAFKSYPAEHQELLAYAMKDALQFIFRKFRDFKAYQSELLKSMDYQKAKDIIQKGWKSYGLEAELSDEDYTIMEDYLFSLKDKNLFQQWMKIENPEYSVYSKALTAAILSDINPQQSSQLFTEVINARDSEVTRFLDLMVYNEVVNLNQASQALSLLEKIAAYFPKNELEAQYFYAQTAIRQKIAPKKGKKALQYCQENFRANKYFDQEDLEKLAAQY